MLAAITVAAYCIGHFRDLGTWNVIGSAASPHGMTMAFLTMNLAEIFHSFNMRTQHGSIFAKKGQNMWLWGSFALALLLTMGGCFHRSDSGSVQPCNGLRL